MRMILSSHVLMRPSTLPSGTAALALPGGWSANGKLAGSPIKETSTFRIARHSLHRFRPE